MFSIFKYTIPIEDYFTLKLPRGAKILSLQEQYNVPQLWALVEKNAPIEIRNFRLAGTGHPIEKSENLEFIGTFQLYGGDFVGHLFEIV